MAADQLLNKRFLATSEMAKILNMDVRYVRFDSDAVEQTIEDRIEEI